MSTANNALEVQAQTLPPVPFQEQNVSMMQQLATAQIQSRYAMAARFPRNIEQARQDMLKECKRPSFCMPDESKNGSSVAIYRVPRGKTNIEGVSIRFAEMALRSYHNLGIDVVVLGEDKDQKLFQVNCVDYETNNVTSEIVSVPKSIERSYTKDTDVVLSTRTNSYGKPVYTILGTDDDIMMKRNALLSKARRNLIMQNIPGWLVEECVDQVRATARAKDIADPDSAKRKIFDAFATVGVTAEQLTTYIGHSNSLSPEKLDELRGYYSGIKEGMTSWRDIVASKDEEGGDDSAKKISELFQKLEYTDAQIRNANAKYKGNAPKLIEWLEGLLAKKQNDGSAKQAVTQQEKQQPATTEAKAGPKTSIPEDAPATKQAEAKPKPAAVATEDTDPSKW